MTPAARRNGGAGETIRYVTAKTAVGWILIAATKRGIRASELGDDPRLLVRRLAARLPAARISKGSGTLRHWTTRVGRAIALGEPLDLPLDIRGTAFQARVWRALEAIPPGKTASYASIAAADRPPNRRPRRGTCLRQQQPGRTRPLPPRHAQRRHAGWLSLGHRAQTRVVGTRA